VARSSRNPVTGLQSAICPARVTRGCCDFCPSLRPNERALENRYCGCYLFYDQKVFLCIIGWILQKTPAGGILLKQEQEQERARSF